MMRLGLHLTFLWYGKFCVPVGVANTAFANMQLSELWPMGLLLQTFFYMHVTRMRKMRTEHYTYETYCFVFMKIRRGIATNTNCIIRNDNI